jgi:hypothetical protein
VNQPCLEPRDLPLVLDLPDDDPRRRHLASCPHCRALLNAYDEFIDPGSEDLGGDLTAADAELAGRLATALGSDHRSGKTSSGWADRFRAPRARFAMAAMLIACAGMFLARDAQFRQDSRLPSGPGWQRGESAAAPQWQKSDGSWQLVWTAGPAAARPVVVCFDAAMGELAQLELGVDARVLDRGLIPAAAVYLQVLFVAREDTVARSAIVSARPTGT